MSIIDNNLQECKKIRDLCEAEHRNPTNEERKYANKLLNEIDIKENDFFFNQDEFPGLANTFPDSENRSSGKPYTIRTYNDRKDYRSMFGSNGSGYRWTDPESNFFEAMFSGRFHPDLKKRSMSETIPSDGGFLVPVEYSEKIHNVSLESELVKPLATVIPMKSNEIRLPATEIGDHSSNLYGGFTASYKAEAAALSEANPAVRQMVLNLNKLSGFLKFSNELMEDAKNGEAQLLDICG